MIRLISRQESLAPKERRQGDTNALQSFKSSWSSYRGADLPVFFSHLDGIQKSKVECQCAVLRTLFILSKLTMTLIFLKENMSTAKGILLRNMLPDQVLKYNSLGHRHSFPARTSSRRTQTLTGTLFSLSTQNRPASQITVRTSQVRTDHGPSYQYQSSPRPLVSSTSNSRRSGCQ
jgi:hypothetical protein